MSAPSGADSKELLEAKIIGQLEINAERHGVHPRGSDASGVFSNLIRDVQKARSQNVVLLIDEYDAPVIQAIQPP
jgi:hypothetical protein